MEGERQTTKQQAIGMCHNTLQRPKLAVPGEAPSGCEKGDSRFSGPHEPDGCGQGRTEATKSSETLPEPARFLCSNVLLLPTVFFDVGV